VRLLQFRRRDQAEERRPDTPAIPFPSIGDSVGRARYIPGDARRLTVRQRAAIGRVVEVQFAGVVPAGPLAGQSMYRECAGEDVLGTAVPEQDLDFVDKRGA